MKVIQRTEEKPGLEKHENQGSFANLGNSNFFFLFLQFYEFKQGTYILQRKRSHILLGFNNCPSLLKHSVALVEHLLNSLLLTSFISLFPNCCPVKMRIFDPHYYTCREHQIMGLSDS